jgi:membrane protein
VVCINFFITPHQVRFKEIKKGSLFTTLFWFVATLLFNIYLKIFTNYKAIYGAVSFFIIFMIWIYLMAQGLVIGFIINFYEKEKNTKLKMDCSDKNIIGTPDEEENEK